MADILIANEVRRLITIAGIVVEKGYRYVKSARKAEMSVRKLIHEVNMLFGLLNSLEKVVAQLEGEDPQDNSS